MCPPTPGHLASLVSSLQGHSRKRTRGHLTAVIVCLEKVAVCGGVLPPGLPAFPAPGPSGCQVSCRDRWTDGLFLRSPGWKQMCSPESPCVSPSPAGRTQARWRRCHEVPSVPFLAPPALSTTLRNTAPCVSLDAGSKQALTCVCKSMRRARP